MNALMELVEVVEVFGLGQKVGLLAKRGPQLLDYAVQVNELIGVDELGNNAHHRADDIDVLRHNLLRTGALHLDGYVIARHQTSAVHLRERCATKRIGVDRIEHLPQAQAVFLFQAAEHYLVRHRLHVGTQTAQLIAKALRQNLGPVGQNLPHLDEHGAELLEQAAQANRREVIPHTVLFDQANNLPMRSRRPAGVSWYSSSGAIASGSSGTISTARGFLRAPETAASTSSTTAASSPKGSRLL